MFVDLDGFKLVNDNLGHRAGDQLLREVGNRIKQCIRESDIVARMGGDEFTVMISQIKSSDSSLIVARKILAKLYEPMFIDEKSCSSPPASVLRFSRMIPLRWKASCRARTQRSTKPRTWGKTATSSSHRK